ncbi:hypothetical protein QBC42DRAFT_234983 [Cladorrhinum samala]|uniref:Uncharacterized protein n=1 Tax=Cladorrhinum samala TaxID=585594 RepID=A0AAV9HDJ3_9PEZI|nr:hypothetical protein QBC42DRAFT_234983 [Cladorrhinum samala]
MMIVRSLVRLCTLLYILFVLYCLFPTICRFLDWARQTSPWSGQKWVEQAWIPTDAELQCLNGSYNSHSSRSSDSKHQPSPSRAPIPNIVHFNFGLKPPLPDSSTRRQFGFLNYLAVRAALLSLSPEKTYLHYTYLSSPPSPDPFESPLLNFWVRRLTKQGVKLIHHPPSRNQQPDRYAHLSDTLRLEALIAQGGIYLDVDAFALRPFDALLSPNSPDAILGHEGGNRWGLCNAVIVSRPNSTFLKRWLASYEAADLSSEWNYHSVRLPKLLADDSSSADLGRGEAKEVCTLPPDAFFWPTWTWRHVEWMHSPLSKLEAEEWEDRIELNGGSLFENQLAYHAWSQMAWDRHLKWLTPARVRRRDTRFNLLVRRFLEDDL